MESERHEPLTVGVVGCGAISDVYLSTITRSPALRLKALSSKGTDSAQRQSARFGGQAVPLETMLADPDIELIVNLTPGQDHLTVNQAVLMADKHLYSEKPLTMALTDAQSLIELAGRRNLRIGGAPDTFLGGAHQAARKLLDSGEIGRPVVGAAFVGHPGVELFHPRPAQFYRPAGQAPYEIGPYYITALVNLLGPVSWIAASCGHGPDERTVGLGPDAGQTFRVSVPTSFSALLSFASGATVTMTTSLDVWKHERRPMELYGTGGSILLADPNFFGGQQRVAPRGQDWRDLTAHDHPLAEPNRTGHSGEPIADYRGIGLVDLSVALRTGRAHRTGPDLIRHVVEVTEAVVTADGQGGVTRLRTTCERPEPLDADRDTELIALMPSPFPIDPLPLGQ